MSQYFASIVNFFHLKAVPLVPLVPEDLLIDKFLIIFFFKTEKENGTDGTTGTNNSFFVKKKKGMARVALMARQITLCLFT